MFRFILVVLYLAICVVLMIPMGIVFAITGAFSIKKRDKLVKIVLNIVFGGVNFISGAKATFKGLEKIPKDKAVLYVANHLSFFDVLLLSPKLPEITGFVAKKSFEKVPVLSQCMRLTHSFFLDRDDIKQGLKVILAAIDQVKSGISVFIFPEGTRSRTGQMAEFKEGSMKVATKSGCPIVPIAISNTSQVFENHLPWLEPARVIIEVLDPIDPNDYDAMGKKHLGKYCHDIIEETKLKNDEEIFALSVKK